MYIRSNRYSEMQHIYAGRAAVQLLSDQVQHHYFLKFFSQIHVLTKSYIVIVSFSRSKSNGLGSRVGAFEGATGKDRFPKITINYTPTTRRLRCGPRKKLMSISSSFEGSDPRTQAVGFTVRKGDNDDVRY